MVFCSLQPHVCALLIARLTFKIISNIILSFQPSQTSSSGFSLRFEIARTIAVTAGIKNGGGAAISACSVKSGKV